MPSKQLHNEVLAGGCETAKHHGPEGRNDLQINRKNKFPGGRNVPSEILLEVLSYPAIPYPAARNRIQSNPSNVDPAMPSKQLHNEVALKKSNPILSTFDCCCCCWWLFKQESNRQTPFSKHSRNGKTPPNFVPKMTQNQSQEQVPWRPERPF